VVNLTEADNFKDASRKTDMVVCKYHFM